MGAGEGIAATLHVLALTTPFLYGAGLCLLIVIVRGFWSWQRLRSIPGPPLASVTSLWMVKKCLTGAFHQHLHHVAELYGTAERICQHAGKRKCDD